MKSGKCCKCRIILNIENSRPSVIKIGSGYCSDCESEYKQQRYQSNPAVALQKKGLNRAERARNQKWYQELKATLQCSRCSENHPACLHFHHIDSGNKVSSVSKMVSKCSIEKILEEIAKCIVLCANCHAKEHYPDLV